MFALHMDTILKQELYIPHVQHFLYMWIDNDTKRCCKSYIHFVCIYRLSKSIASMQRGF